MSVFRDVNLSLFDTPAEAPAPVPPPEPEITFILKKTRSGRDIMVCSASPAPAHIVERAAIMGLPLFTGPEIMIMKNCPPEMVDHILAVKNTFAGADVEQIILEGVS
jgi:hypothetical protein